VERNALRRQEDELERKESDLGHAEIKPSRPAPLTGPITTGNRLPRRR
jgi:hypothetical protein